MSTIITDKNNRNVRLTKERWIHIRTEHPNVENQEEIIETIKKPDRTIYDE